MGRYTRKEFINFLVIARGSVEECKYLLLLSNDLKYLEISNYNDFKDKFDKLGKMINALLASLKRKL